MTWLITLVLAGAFHHPGPILSFEEEICDENVAAGITVAEDETTDKTYPLSLDGRVSVSNINGSVEMTGWDRPEVRLIAKKIANSAERLDDLMIDVSSTADSFRVSVNYKRWKGKWVKGDTLYVNFTLMVPRTAIVDEIESVNGKVTVSKLSNITVVSAVNGAVLGSELSGKVKLSTVNGSVMAQMAGVDPNSEISLETVNGSAQVQLPSNVDATVKADSVNGSIKNQFGLPVKKGKYVGRELYGKIGAGFARVRLTTVNGSISINRLDDGLPVNPVENLLPLKTSDDFDESLEENLRESIKQGRNNSIEVELDELDLSAIAEVEKAALLNADEVAAKAAKIAVEAIDSTVVQASAADVSKAAIEAELAGIDRKIIVGSQTPFIIEDSRTIEVKGTPTVEVLANGTNIVLKGWDKNDVSYEITRLARGVKSPVRKINVSTDKDSVRLSVELFSPPALGDVLEQVRVEIHVPKNSNLKIKTDREIRLEGVIGELELTGKYGRVDVRDAGGQLTVRNKSGTVRVIGFEGELTSEVINGDQYLEGTFESIRADSGSGSVFLTLPKSAGAVIQTNSIGLPEEQIGKGKMMYIGGLKLIEQPEGLWKLGNGGPEYVFRFKTGKLILRSIETIRS